MYKEVLKHHRRNMVYISKVFIVVKRNIRDQKKTGYSWHELCPSSAFRIKKQISYGFCLWEC